MTATDKSAEASQAAPVLARQRVAWQLKFAALALIWGSSFLLIMVALRSFAPLQVTSLRLIAGSATLFVLLKAARGRLPRGRRVWLHLAITGLFLGALPFTLFAVAETRVSSALAGIGNATTPLSSVLFGLAMLPAYRLDRLRLAAVGVGFAGVIVILQPWQAVERPDPIGFGCALLGGASYGLGWTLVKRYLGQVDAGGLALPAGQMLAAATEVAVVLVGWWAVTGTGSTPWSPRADASGPTGLSLLAVLVLGVLGTGLAMSLQFDVVRATGPTVATTVTYLIPVVAACLGVAMLGERLQPAEIAGAAIILASAVVIGTPRRQSARLRAGAQARAGARRVR